MAGSVIDALGWPNEIRVLLFSISVILILTPVISGFDFGFVKIPRVTRRSGLWIAALGIVLLGIMTIAGLPLRSDGPHEISADFTEKEFNKELQDSGETYWLTEKGLVNHGERSYISTSQNDYLSRNFIAEITYHQKGGGGPAGVFFGVGSAKKNTEYYDEPLRSIFFLDQAEDFTIFPGVEVRAWGSRGSKITDDLTFYKNPVSYSGMVMVRIEKIADVLEFTADMDFSGSKFEPDLSVEVSVKTLLSVLDLRDARIFFGTGSDNVVFYRFMVREEVKQ